MTQCLFAAVSVAVSLVFFDVTNNTVIAAAFGSSSFVVFSMPHRKISTARNLIGGYLIGIGAGLIFYFIAQNQINGQIGQKVLYIVSGSMAVGLSMFLMAITNTEHAPASGVALGVVIGSWTGKELLFVMTGIVVIVGIHKVLKKRLIDLLDV